MLKVLISIWIVLAILSIVLVSNKKQSHITNKQEDLFLIESSDSFSSSSSNSDELSISLVSTPTARRILPMTKILLSKHFIFVLMIGTLQEYFGYFINNSYKQIGQKYIADDEFLSWVGSLSNLANGLWKICLAVFIDRFDLRRVYMSIMEV